MKAGDHDRHNSAPDRPVSALVSPLYRKALQRCGGDQAGRCNMPSAVHVEPAVRAEAIAAAEIRDDGAVRRSGGGAAARVSFTIMYLATVAIDRPIFVDR